MKKSFINLSITISVFTLLITGCQKEESQDSLFSKFETENNVTISKNFLKTASRNNITNVNSLDELKKEISQIKQATEIKKSRNGIILNNNRFKIMGYQYQLGEIGGGSNSEVYGEMQFSYPCVIASFCQFNVLPNFVYNPTTGLFTEWGISTTGYTGQYSATMYASNRTYGTYVASIQYHVTITRNFAYQGNPIGTSFNRHYTIYINKQSGQITYGVEY